MTFTLFQLSISFSDRIEFTIGTALSKLIKNRIFLVFRSDKIACFINDKTRIFLSFIRSDKIACFIILLKHAILSDRKKLKKLRVLSIYLRIASIASIALIASIACFITSLF